jgi:transcriptional regulator with XRE-family HTH domain
LLAIPLFPLRNGAKDFAVKQKRRSFIEAQNNETQKYWPHLFATIQNGHNLPRQVELKLDSLFHELAPGTTKIELADRLGISEGTLRAYFENRWTVLDRTVMERLADFFQCDAAQLLTTSESNFFDPFRTLSGKERSTGNPTCLFLCRPDAHVLTRGRPVALRDIKAMGHVTEWLRDSVHGIVEIRDSATTSEQFEESLSQNCVMVGSPIVNPASEMAICRVFGVEPFSPDQGAKLPFAFRTVPTPATPSSILEAADDGKLGIWLRDEKQLLQAHSWPREDFRKVRIQDGRDWALVVVSNHQTTGQSPVRKLVVLSGSGGVATEAAAHALVRHYRDLEPREPRPVWGIIEVFYRKPADSTTRELLNYSWRWRVGGRCPLDFTRRKAASSGV